MKNLLTTLLLFFLYVSQAWGIILIQTPASTGPEPDFYSGFEDATDRGQWTLSGTPDTDHSSSGLSMTGSYVARFDGGEGIYAYEVSGTEAVMVVQLRNEDDTFSDYGNQWSYFRDTGSAIVCYGRNDNTNGAWQVTSLASGGTTSSAITGLYDDTTYWMKLYYKVGTGTDSECTLGVWNGSSWDEVSSTDGTSTANLARLILINQSLGAGKYIYVDQAHVFLGTDYTGDPTTL